MPAGALGRIIGSLRNVVKATRAVMKQGNRKPADVATAHKGRVGRLRGISQKKLHQVLRGIIGKRKGTRKS